VTEYLSLSFLASLTGRLTTSELVGVRVVTGLTSHLSEGSLHSGPGAAFQTFKPLSISDVIRPILRQSDKYSAADPILTNVLKPIADLIAPFIVALFNRLLGSDRPPANFNQAFITPIVKRSIRTRLVRCQVVPTHSQRVGYI
jgi:hypothetical protein